MVCSFKLSTVVNQYSVNRLIQLAGARRITPTHDIVDVHGIAQDHGEALSARKLRKATESALRVDDAVDTDVKEIYSTFSLDSPGSGSG